MIILAILHLPNLFNQLWFLTLFIHGREPCPLSGSPVLLGSNNGPVPLSLDYYILQAYLWSWTLLLFSSWWPPGTPSLGPLPLWYLLQRFQMKFRASALSVTCQNCLPISRHPALKLGGFVVLFLAYFDFFYDIKRVQYSLGFYNFCVRQFM